MVFGRQQTRLPDDRRVAVIGLGRFGTALSRALVVQGVEVLAVDSSERAVQAVSDTITHAVVADTTDIEALNQIGIVDFDHVVVAIGSDVEDSILTTSLLADMDIPDIWAKAVTEQHGKILRRVGAHHVVSPESEMGVKVAHLVTGRLIDFVAMDDNLALVKTRVPRHLVGTVVNGAHIDGRSGVQLVARRGPSDDFRPLVEGNTLDGADVLVAIGHPDALRDFTSGHRRHPG